METIFCIVEFYPPQHMDILKPTEQSTDGWSNQNSAAWDGAKSAPNSQWYVSWPCIKMQ